MKFSDDFLSRLKTDDRLPGLMRELMPDFRRNGKGYVARVPWRADTNPSLHFFQGAGGVWLFQDMALGGGGDVITLVEQITDRGFAEAVSWLADRLGVLLPTREAESTKTAAASVEMRIEALRRVYDLAKPLSDGTTPAEYLRGRGLLEAAKALGVRGCEPGEPREIIADAYNLGLGTPATWVKEGYGFLVYAANMAGQVIAHRCRLLMSQSEARTAGFDSAHWTPSTKDGLTLPTTWPTLPTTLPGEVVLTEGETDTLAVRTLAPGTQSFAIFGTSRFNDRTPEFRAVAKAKPTITLAFQRDAASTKAGKRIGEAFKRHGVDCRALVPAGGAKDWAELLAWDQAPVQSLDEIAAVLGDCSIGQSFDALDKHISDIETGQIENLPLPWPTLTWAFNGAGLPPKTVGLLSSRTGQGKSWWVYQLALFVAGFRLSRGLPVFVANSEMSASVVASRLLALASGDGTLTTMADAEKLRAAQFEYQALLDRLPLEITEPEPRSCDDVVELLAEKAQTHKLLVVDHIGDLSFQGKSWEALPRFVLQLRDLARRTGAVILLVTHLKSGEDSDVLSYSRQIENIVDWSFSLQAFDPMPATLATPCGRDEEEINRTLTIRKNRFGRSGLRIGMIFDETTLAYCDLGRVINLGNMRKSYNR